MAPVDADRLARWLGSARKASISRLGVEPLLTALSTTSASARNGTWRVSEIWDSREQFEAYGKQLSVMPVMADIPFDSGGPPEIFEVHKLRKR